MKTGDSKRLVIDTDVAQASGSETATHPRAKHCRDFLRKVLSLGHSVVITPKIRDEWTEHKSRFANRWRVSMKKRRRICCVNPPADKELRDKIEEAAEQKNQIPVMRKDFHLLEAARISDQTIISLEKRVRRHFARAAQNVDEIQNLVWVNPEKEKEEPLVWIENGAPPEVHRQLRTWGRTHLSK